MALYIYHRKVSTVMVMPNFSYSKRIFAKCAVFVDPNNPRDIARKIKYILDNPGIAKKMGGRGRKLVETKYSWEAESRKLIGMYKEVLK